MAGFDALATTAAPSVAVQPGARTDIAPQDLVFLREVFLEDKHPEVLVDKVKITSNITAIA